RGEGRGSPVRGQPYERYLTQDPFEREITFYLSETPRKEESLPLIVFVQGSGCSSLFVRRNGTVVSNLGHSTLQEIAERKARVLLVEKPGVKFLEQREDCTGAKEFNREFSLERWAEALEAAIRAATTLEQIKKGKVLVIGHSEGGLVACRVARDLPGLVTH